MQAATAAAIQAAAVQAAMQANGGSLAPSANSPDAVLAAPTRVTPSPGAAAAEDARLSMPSLPQRALGEIQRVPSAGKLASLAASAEAGSANPMMPQGFVPFRSQASYENLLKLQLQTQTR